MSVMHPALSIAEIELRFGVPKGKRSALLQAMRGGDYHSQRRRAIYYDTADGKLAGHGISLRLRKEGRIWTQTAEIDTADPLLRLDHNVIVMPQGLAIIPVVALERHRDTAIFSKIMNAIGGDEKNLLTGGLADTLEERFRTDIQRHMRTVSHGISQAVIALDSGSIYRDKQSLPVSELTLTLRGCCEISVALLRLLVVLRVLSASPRLATLISQQPLRTELQGFRALSAVRQHKIRKRIKQLHHLSDFFLLCSAMVLSNTICNHGLKPRTHWENAMITDWD